MSAPRPPAPTPPAVGPATCAAAAQLAEAACDLLLKAAGDTAGLAECAEAAQMLRSAADLVAPAGPVPGPVTREPPSAAAELRPVPAVASTAADEPAAEWRLDPPSDDPEAPWPRRIAATPADLARRRRPGSS